MCETDKVNSLAKWIVLVVVIFCALTLSLGSPKVQAYPDGYMDTHWSGNQVTMNIHPSDFPSGGSWHSRIISAMSSWYYPNCPGSNFTTYYLANPVQRDPEDNNDGYNTIGWGTFEWGILAQTLHHRSWFFWWSWVEADIAVNLNADWALDENSADPVPPYETINFEGVVCHEMGHVTGLSPHEDRTPRVALMNSIYSFGSEEDWWMHGDDRNGLRTLYSGSGTEVDVQLIGWKKTTNSSSERSVPVNAPSPTTVCVGDNVTVQFTGENLGTQSHNNVFMRVYLSTNVIITTSDIPVGNGSFNFAPASGGNSNVPIVTAQMTVTIPTVQSGTYYLGGIVDYNNALSETREGNNAIVFPYPQNPQPITVKDKPVAAFYGSPTSGCASLTVSFYDQSTNDPTSWSWNFGDGGTSTLQNPTHTYTSKGTYTVTLTASNVCGSDGETKNNYITVLDKPTSPTPITDSTQAGSNRIKFCWEDLPDETQYKVYRDGAVLANLNPNVTCFTDTAPLVGKHYYTISASNTCGESDQSIPIYDSLYFVGGNVTDDQGDTLVSAMVFVISRLQKGMQTFPLIVDTAITNSIGNYQFLLPAGHYLVFRDSVSFPVK